MANKFYIAYNKKFPNNKFGVDESQKKAMESHPSMGNKYKFIEDIKPNSTKKTKKKKVKKLDELEPVSGSTITLSGDTIITSGDTLQ